MHQATPVSILNIFTVLYPLGIGKGTELLASPNLTSSCCPLVLLHSTCQGWRDGEVATQLW